MAAISLKIKIDLAALEDDLHKVVKQIVSSLQTAGVVDVKIDDDEIKSKLTGIRQKMDEVDNSTTKVKSSFKTTAFELLKWVGIAETIRRSFNFLIDSKNVARDAAEIQSKFDVVFSNLKIEANSWAESFAKSVGRAKSDVKSWMSELQDTFVPLGFTRTKAMELSESLTKLAVDVASFNNASDPEVIRDFTSALVGNHETVRKYGILITENSLKQEALDEGFKKNYASLTELEKVQLRYNIILKSTSDAQGDAIRTADSLANTEKRRAAELKNLQETMGSKVAPAFLLVTQAAIGWFNVINDILGIEKELIDKNQIKAAQLEELKNIYNKYPEAFEKYRLTLEADTEMRIANAQAALAQAVSEYELAKARKNSLGIAGVFYSTGDEEEAMKNAQRLVQTYQQQLDVIKNFHKITAEDTADTVSQNVNTTKNKVAEMYDDLRLNEKNQMDEMLDDQNLYLEELGNIKIADEIDIEQRRISAMQNGKAKEMAQLDLWYQTEMDKASTFESNKQELIDAIQQQHVSKRAEINDKYNQQEEQRIQALSDNYAQHFHAILGMAMNATNSQRSLAKQLQSYMINLLKQYLVQFIATKFAEKTIHATTEAEKTATTQANVALRLVELAAEIAKTLATAAASIVQAIASGIAYLFATFGPFAIPMIGGLTAAAIGTFNGVKKLLGFSKGGYTGPGDPGEPAGIVHKEEYVFEQDLVGKEPGNFEMLRALLRRGFTVGDILSKVAASINPVQAPLALSGINIGYPLPSASSAQTPAILDRVVSFLQSMDDRLKKIEEKEFKLKGEVVAETKLNNKDLYITVKHGEKEMNKGKA